MGLRLITSAWRNFYAVDDDGLLRWYRYLGNGEPNPVPGAVNWHPNSGNPIGHGWDGFTSIHAAANGVIAAVHGTGNLHWYRYTGDGHSDWTGNIGWEPNSGAVINGGWNEFTHIVPWAGTSDTDIGLLTVTAAGDLRWYYFYNGWHPNSGNVIASGWDQFVRLTGAFSTIFAVTGDGDLRWYDYRGSGEFDPSGTLGWQRNSGNIVGRGWGHFGHLMCSLVDVAAASYELYGSQGGNLRWYRYHGHGVPDPTGAHGWDINSRNIISGGW